MCARLDWPQALGSERLKALGPKRLVVGELVTAPDLDATAGAGGESELLLVSLEQLEQVSRDRYLRDVSRCPWTLVWRSLLPNVNCILLFHAA